MSTYLLNFQNVKPMFSSRVTLLELKCVCSKINDIFLTRGQNTSHFTLGGFSQRSHFSVRKGHSLQSVAEGSTVCMGLLA